MAGKTKKAVGLSPEDDAWLLKIVAGSTAHYMVVTSEPVVSQREGVCSGVAIDPLPGPASEVIGFMDWSKVTSVTWRPLE